MAQILLNAHETRRHWNARKEEKRTKCYHSHNGEGGRIGIPLKVRLEALDLVHDLMDAHQLVTHRHCVVGWKGHDLLETVVQLDQLRQQSLEKRRQGN